MAKLPKDIYYRNYRLHITGDGHRANDVLVYKDAEHLETCGGLDFAKAYVDEVIKQDLRPGEQP